jgi:hypothetical protein
VTKIEKVTTHARQAGAVTDNLWSTVAGKGADLESQRDLYRRKVSHHINALSRLEGHSRREYLESNAEAIAFDSYALFSSLKAWVGYQVLLAAREGAAGPAASPESRAAAAILDEIRTALGPGLHEITNLVSTLSRELQLVAKLPGRSTLPRTKKRKDAEAASRAARELLKAIQPLTDHLLPPLPEAPGPEVLCLPQWVDPNEYLTVLRLLLDREEHLRAVGVPYELSADGPLLDKTTMVAVTDRRILTSRAKQFLRTGEIGKETPVDQVRYVRWTAAPHSGWPRARIDVITKGRDLRWDFAPDIADEQIAGLAGLLAESMGIPESERLALVERRTALIMAAPSQDQAAGDVGDA